LSKSSLAKFKAFWHTPGGIMQEIIFHLLSWTRVCRVSVMRIVPCWPPVNRGPWNLLTLYRQIRRKRDIINGVDVLFYLFHYIDMN